MEVMEYHSHVEIERKYDVGESAVPPHLAEAGAVAVQDEPETVELVATYYDTEELVLAAQGIAVRSRRGGTDEGWHFKYAPVDDGRVEMQWPLGDGEHEPGELRELIFGVVGDAPLVPIARIVNTRVVTVLRDAAGCALAELCDDHVSGENLRSGGHDEWREWEVELVSGAPGSKVRHAALLDDVEERLVAAGARPSASGSKLQHVLSL